MRRELHEGHTPPPARLIPSGAVVELRFDRCELNAFVAPLIVNKMGFDDQSHDAFPNFG
jgi:hypothetical protein